MIILCQVIEDKDLIEFAFSRSRQMFVAWNFLIVVSLGVVGYVAKTEGGQKRASMRIPFIFGFSLFAISNLFAIVNIRNKGQAFLDRVTPTNSTLAEELSYSPVWAFVMFHLLISFSVFSALVVLTKASEE